MNNTWQIKRSQIPTERLIGIKQLERISIISKRAVYQEIKRKEKTVHTYSQIL